MSITVILYVLAFVCFILGWFNVKPLSWLCGGLAFLTLTLLVR